MRHAEATLIEAREAVRVAYHWSESLQYSLRYGQSWRIERDADRVRDSVTKLHELLFR